tara:strand:+ start:589 stop:927 length:339 start_codon:yes stop_codon:yes gene_type:complete
MANLLNDNTHLVQVDNLEIITLGRLADNYKNTFELSWEFGDIIRTIIQAEIKRRLRQGNGVIGLVGKDRTPEELHLAVVGLQEYWESSESRKMYPHWEQVAEMLEEVAETIL